MNLENIWNGLKESLKIRKNYLTEDGLRYLLFAHFLKEDHNLDNYVLELPYNAINENGISELIIEHGSLKDTKKELDFYYKGEGEKIVAELKFHRESKQTTTKTMNAGTLFNDFRRLNLIKNDGYKKILIYVFDTIMHDYYIPGRNAKGIGNKVLNDKFRQLFNMEKGEMTFEFFDGFDESKTGNVPNNFFKHAAASFSDEFNNLPNQKLRIKTLFSDEVITKTRTSFDADTEVTEKRFWIKVFEVI